MEEMKRNLNDKRATLNVLKERIQNTTKDLEELPAKLSRLLTNLENAYNNDKAAIEAAVQLTIAKIENDMLSFSTHFLKDRVNTFLQGWNDYLYDYFAVPVAQQKWKATQEEADKWLAEKIQTTSIQNRNS